MLEEEKVNSGSSNIVYIYTHLALKVYQYSLRRFIPTSQITPKQLSLKQHNSAPGLLRLRELPSFIKFVLSATTKKFYALQNFRERAQQAGHSGILLLRVKYRVWSLPAVVVKAQMKRGVPC